MTLAGKARLVLASASPRRLALLEQIGLKPDIVAPSEIDETPLKQERPRQLALRLAVEKGRAAKATHGGDFVLSADTVVACGRRILPKAETQDEARACLDTLSGRAHDVITGIAVLAPDGREASRVVESRVTFKRLSREEIEGYIAVGEWRGKAGGYAIQGRAAALITDISGSYSGIVGLPLHETACLLEGLGYPLGRRWSAPT
ncbi:MAG TPA: Maf family nucleotide pyrophosphatase [Hyphomonadaceae bacterium]|nr:Maf family nucleotide pyrophosphatase [Hyphomonadaceae bacterium]